MKLRKFKRLEAYKQLVKNLVEQKVLERGLLCCDDKQLRQLEREAKREIEQRVKAEERRGCYNDYIAPDLYRIRCKRDYNTRKLYDLKYELTTYDGDQVVAILSDTMNIQPRVVKKCISYREGLKRHRTKSEETVRSMLKDARRIECLFQKAFYVCGSLYFADFYFPRYKTILEIDGGYHGTRSQKLKDEKRTSFFESVGIKVLRVSNEDTENPMLIWEKIMALVKEYKKKNK